MACSLSKHGIEMQLRTLPANIPRCSLTYLTQLRTDEVTIVFTKPVGVLSIFYNKLPSYTATLHNMWIKQARDYQMKW
jgi:hypothetical protein